MLAHATAERSKSNQWAAAKVSGGTAADHQIQGGFNGPNWNFAAIAVSRAPLSIQPRLEIGAVDDPLEREADTVAERVIRMPDPASSFLQPGSDSIVQRKCSACEDDEKGYVQRKESSTLQPPSAPPVVGEVLSSPGQPLDRSTRCFMETRFGHSFGDVRLHVGRLAADSARAVNAQAYTVGRDIVFGDSRYQPTTSFGQRLLAHELAHVVQQRGESSETAVQRQALGSCAGRGAYQCNGVKCTAASGRSGTCMWTSAKECVCRDNSGDEPGPSGLKLPSWLLILLSAAALAAIAACFATGVCEFGLVVAGLGAAAAAAVIAILRAAGIEDKTPGA